MREPSQANDPPRRPRLSHLLPAPLIAAHLLAPGKWQPYPGSPDRHAWEEVDPSARRLLLDEAVRLANEAAPTLSARLWARWGRDGDRAEFEDSYFARRTRLAAFALAAALSGGGRFLDLAVEEVWQVCEESSWCLPAHDWFSMNAHVLLPDPEKPYLDLFAAETGALLAHVDLIIGDAFDEDIPGLRSRLRAEVRRRVLRPYRQRDDWHWYAGRPTNWNPWIHSNVLAACLLLDEGRDDMLETVDRVVSGLDRFLDDSPGDGGCDEGIMYWWRSGATLFECLDALYRASGGALDAFAEPVIRAMARYPLATHIDQAWQVNYGDGTAISETHVVPSRLSSNPPDLLHRFGRRVGDAQVCAHARAMRGDDAPPIVLGASLSRTLAGLFDADWAQASATYYPYLGQCWLPDTELFTAREQPGSADGLFISAKGGHNDEGHNHNDVGAFILALDGTPVIVDVGVGEYDRTTFGPDRYSIWTMRSIYHNLPAIDGIEQAPGPKHRARAVRAKLDEQTVEFSLDLAGAYPPQAGMRRWERTLTLDRPRGQVTLRESWDLDRFPERVELHLMTTREPQIDDAGAIHLPAPGRRSLVLHPQPAMAVAVETIALSDRKLVSVWGPRLFRLTLMLTPPAQRGGYVIAMSAEPMVIAEQMVIADPAEPAR